MELVDASNIHGGDKRQELKESIMTVLIEGLMPAFETLQKIRASKTQQMPMLNRMQLYEDFSRGLWHAYRDLMPRATKLLGFDLSFLFDNNSKFDKGRAIFEKEHPSLIAPQLGEFLKNQRDAWQNELASFRNHYLEHRVKNQNRFAAFYDPEYAEFLFNSVWQLMADIFPAFIEANFSTGYSIEQIPLNERDPIARRRFRFVLTGPIAP